MSFAFVQSRSAAGFGAVGPGCSFSSNNTAGNLLVVGAIGWSSGMGSTAASISDAQGNSYTTIDFIGVNTDSTF